ncbi:MAG: hydrolase, partial [Kiritimatiellae bacterium]|nr:hydrolase [Kiritimatiellia bacterium]
MSEPNARRTTHLTRDAAWELLTRYNKDAFHLHHAETVEKTMRYFARELGYAEDEDYWGIVGMLHDIDFEQWPQQHCVKSQTLLKELGVEDSINRAVASHGYAICTDIAPEHEMEKILYAV